MASSMSDQEFAAALGRVEACLGRESPQDAVPDLHVLLSAAPNHPMVLCGVGRVSIQLGDNEAALQALDLALQVSPNLLEARNARGVALQNLGRFDDAEAEFRRIVEALPDNPGALLNLASLLAAKGTYAVAETTFRRVLELNPGDATAAYNLGLLQLLQGDFAAGWRGFELRGRASNVGLAAVRSVAPRWTGQEAPDATLLVHAEQGLGDNIQFARYVTAAAERVGKLILEAPEPLVDLFRQIPGPAQVIGRDAPLPSHDLHVPIMSLPAAFGTDETSIPWSGPYIAADPSRTRDWRRNLGADDGRFHVGLIWAGNPGHKRDRDRSVPLALLAPLLEVEGVVFHALQADSAITQLSRSPFRGRMTRVFQRLLPFTEVAAAVSALDLVIGADTSIVHLAGAMGRPAWVMVSFVPDWRWMLSRDDSPWYPTFRLFRQPAPGDWPVVAGDLSKALAEAAKSKLDVAG